MTSLYDISIPVCQKVLAVTASILKKGEAWAAENGVAPAELLKLRIYEDMLPLSVQVLIVIMTTRKCIERLTGTAPPEVKDALGREWTSAETGRWPAPSARSWRRAACCWWAWM